VQQARIKVLENFLATEVLLEKGRVAGIKALDCRRGTLEEFGCRYLILATGGAGQQYKFTTNSNVATGDGIALAFNAGAQVTNMEFFQFHPTALRLPGVEPFLITEAVRGEGGVLRNVNGNRFMPDYAAEADLAPRDVTARSIVYEMAKTKADRVFLDLTHLPNHLTTTRFPHIYRFCLEHGLDITREPIPVAPAAHYMIGGIKTDVWGETSVPGLFAGGETACTGVHGANRLASNSLLEAVVFSKRIVDKINEGGDKAGMSWKVPEVSYNMAERPSRRSLPIPSLAALQQLQWDKVGIIRNKDGLQSAANTLARWQKKLPRPTDRPSFELRNLVLTARLVTEAALIREESRGAHFRTDFPSSTAEWRHHIVLTR
jgi:L-aspartate oxidase